MDLLLDNLLLRWLDNMVMVVMMMLSLLPYHRYMNWCLKLLFAWLLAVFM